MARPRTIDRDLVLDAGERVVMRDGASNLTVDAVAAEAGISKGSVLYDCKNKHALIKAIMERRIAVESERIAQAVKAQGDRKNAEIRGRIAAGVYTRQQESGAATMQLCSALAQDEDLHGLVKDAVAHDIAAVQKNSDNPQAAMVALLALEGLRFLSLMNFYTWTDEELEQHLNAIEALVT